MNPTIDNIRALAERLQDEAWNDGKSGVARASERTVAAFDALRAAIEQALTPGEPVALALGIIENLWAIIDDIDTYSDMAKGDDKLYRIMVERRQADRWKTGITTDGYTLTYPTAAPQPKRKPQPPDQDDAAASVNETNAILASRYFDLLKVVEGYEKHGVTCQTFRNFVDSPCAECNSVTAPQLQREWVGLTEHEVYQWWRSENGLEDCDMARIGDFRNIVRSVEAKLREKNGGGV
jgi:hypothetical protein